MAVLVLDKHQRALMPCTEKRARLLLSRGRKIISRADGYGYSYSSKMAFTADGGSENRAA